MHVPDLHQQHARNNGGLVKSIVPSGAAIAPELPYCSSSFPKVPRSFAELRPGTIPNTLADLLKFVSPNSRRRHGRSFKLIEEWRARPAEQILLSELFIRLTMSGFRPFLREKGYLENTIVAYR